MTARVALLLIVFLGAVLTTLIRLRENERRRRAAFKRRMTEIDAERAARLGDRHQADVWNAPVPSHSATLTHGAQRNHG